MYFPERKLRAQKTSVILEDTAQVKTDFSNKTVSVISAVLSWPTGFFHKNCITSFSRHFSVAASVSHDALNFLSFLSAKISKSCSVIVTLIKGQVSFNGAVSPLSE